MWGWVSYDPTLNLLYYGTSNPGPWNADMRPGDNKWTSGIFARDPDTGEAVWFYQWSPHDLWDHDGVNENILVDADLGGTRRQLLLHPERNGYVYVLDRKTGEVLSADPFTHITTSRGVDLKTGRLQVIHEKTPTPIPPAMPKSMASEKGAPVAGFVMPASPSRMRSAVVAGTFPGRCP